MKRRRPPTDGGYAPLFSIRNHRRLVASVWARLPASVRGRWTVVHKVGGIYILRPVSSPMKPSAACPPDLEVAISSALRPDRVVAECLAKVDALDRRNDMAGLSQVLYEALGRLGGKARAGDGVALHVFCMLAIEACEGMGQIVRAFPEVVRPLARRRITWPLMKARHPRNGDPDSILGRIELGADTPIFSDKHSKWKPDFAAQVAADLIGWIVDHHEPEPPLTKETAEEWWTVAKAALLRSYPRPEEVRELKAIVTAASRKLSPGRARESILTTIHARFLAVLASQS